MKLAKGASNMAYYVMYYSDVAGQWIRCAPIAHNSKPIKYATIERANSALAAFERIWPRDKFKIEEIEGSK